MCPPVIFRAQPHEDANRMASIPTPLPMVHLGTPAPAPGTLIVLTLTNNGPVAGGDFTHFRLAAIHFT